MINMTYASIFVSFVNVSEDGWWEAENTAGKQGVVPKTLLKVMICFLFLSKQHQ